MMLKNNLPQSPDDEYQEDWAFWAIKIDRLNRDRTDAMNEGKRKKARALWFAVQEAELELGKAIDRIK